MYLRNKRGYLGGPIENDTTNLNWRIEPKSILRERFEIDIFDPHEDPKQQWVPNLNKARQDGDYETMVTIAKAFVRKDLCMVDRSDFIISCLPHKVATCGSHHEIINSANAKKPTLLVCPQGKKYIPLWYYGFVPHTMMFGSWTELYDYLEEVNEGKHIGEFRWAFVYGII